MLGQEIFSRLRAYNHFIDSYTYQQSSLEDDLYNLTTAKIILCLDPILENYPNLTKDIKHRLMILEERVRKEMRITHEEETTK